MSLIDPNSTEIGSPIWALAKLFPPQGSWSSDEYLQLDAGRLVGFDGGLLEIHELPTPESQRLVLLIYRWLFAWSKQRQDPGEVFVAPLPIRLWSDKCREPDVVWVENTRPRIGGYRTLTLQPTLWQTRKAFPEGRLLGIAGKGLGAVIANLFS